MMMCERHYRQLWDAVKASECGGLLPDEMVPEITVRIGASNLTPEDMGTLAGFRPMEGMYHQILRNVVGMLGPKVVAIGEGCFCCAAEFEDDGSPCENCGLDHSPGDMFDAAYQHIIPAMEDEWRRMMAAANKPVRPDPIAISEVIEMGHAERVLDYLRARAREVRDEAGPVLVLSMVGALPNPMADFVREVIELTEAPAVAAD